MLTVPHTIGWSRDCVIGSRFLPLLEQLFPPDGRATALAAELLPELQAAVDLPVEPMRSNTCHDSHNLMV